MKYLIILCLFATSAFAGNLNNNSNLNGNLNNNKANSKAVSGAVSGASSSLNAGYISDTTVNNSTEIPVSSAYAPPAIPTSDCLGSVSAGGQSQFMGLSLGVTKQSKPCNIREYAKMFRHIPTVYKAILCQDDIVKTAFEATDYACPTKPNKNKDWIVHEYPDSTGR